MREGIVQMNEAEVEYRYLISGGWGWQCLAVEILFCLTRALVQLLMWQPPPNASVNLFIGESWMG